MLLVRKENKRNHRIRNRLSRWLYPLISLAAPLLPSDSHKYNQPVVELNADKNFFSIYKKQEIQMFLDELDLIITKINRIYPLNRVFIRIPKIPCIGEIHTDAMTGFLVKNGEKGLLLCFAFLTSPDKDLQPKEYWLNEWLSIFEHEYKHVLEYAELGADPFSEDPYKYLKIATVAAKENGIDAGFVEAGDIESAKTLKRAIQEIRTLMELLDSESSGHGNIQKRFILFAESVEIIKKQGRLMDILLAEIITDYLLNNETFRNATGGTKTQQLEGAHEKFYGATQEIISEDDGLEAVYNEMKAYAKLAEKEGFKMNE